jgi:hypothetical protein
MTRKGQVMAATTERKIRRAIEEERQASIEEGIKLPNQCLGNGCITRLPRGEHFCNLCRNKNNNKKRKSAISSTNHRCGNPLSGESR